MNKNLILIPNNVFKNNHKESFEEYPVKWQPPYKVYSAPFQSEDKGKVIVMISGPSVKESNKKSLTIELFDLSVGSDMKGEHLSIVILPSGQNRLLISSKSAYAREASFFQKLWKSSPYVLVKSLAAIEQKCVADGFIFNPVIIDAFDLDNMEPSIKWPEFYQKYKQFFLPLNKDI